MTQYERAPSVSGEHPTAHSGEGRKEGAGAPIVGPVAPSGLLRAPCGCCTVHCSLVCYTSDRPSHPIIYHPVTRVGRFFAFLCDP